MSGPLLRRAVADDARRLALLGGATFLHAFAHDHPGDVLIDHIEACHSRAWYQAALADPDSAGWIVETPLGAPIGYALMTPPGPECVAEPGDLELKRLYMLGQWQSGGWGRRLVEAVEAEARLRQAGRLMLCVYTDNLGAQRFYARHGFVDTGIRQKFFDEQEGFVDQIWVKPLLRG